MINAWVLYTVGKTKEDKPIYRFEERLGESYQTTDPELWGLEPQCKVIMTFQTAQFLDAWVLGASVRKY